MEFKSHPCEEKGIPGQSHSPSLSPGKGIGSDRTTEFDREEVMLCTSTILVE